MKQEHVSAIRPATSIYERAIAPSDLLDEMEVSTTLGLATGTMRNWRSRGIGIPYIKLGKRAVRYRRADVDAFIASGLANVEAA